MYNIEEIKNKIICGDAVEELKKIPDNSIDMIITSPPYNVGMPYGIDDRKNYFDYLEFAKNWLIECYRILINGGRIAINLPSSILQSSSSRMAYLTLDYVNLMRDIGFLDREWITWIKMPKGEIVGKSTSWGSWRSPSCFGENTKILMSDWLWKDIKDVKVGDKVIGVICNNKFQHSRYHFIETKVLNTFNRVAKTGILNGHTIVTPEHLYFYENDYQEIQLLNNKKLRFFEPPFGIYSHRNFCNINFDFSNPRINKVYNITTETGNYIADGFIVHNCPYLRDASEFIIIMDKNQHKRVDKKGQNDITAKEFLLYTSNCWYIPPEKNRKHPAPFPLELPLRIIKLYTWQDDIVLDPFIGSGTTAVACKMLGRNYIGIEINPEYVEMAEERLKRVADNLF